MSCNNFNQVESSYYYPNCYNEYYEEESSSQEVFKKCCPQVINYNCCKQSSYGCLNKPTQNCQQGGEENYERQCNNYQQFFNKKCCKKHYGCFERNCEPEIEKIPCKENNRSCCKKGIFSGFFKIC